MINCRSWNEYQQIDAVRAFVASVKRGSLAWPRGTWGIRRPEPRDRRCWKPGWRCGSTPDTRRRCASTEFARLLRRLQMLAALDAGRHRSRAEQDRPTGMLHDRRRLVFGQLHLRPVIDAFLDAPIPGAAQAAAARTASPISSRKALTLRSVSPISGVRRWARRRSGKCGACCAPPPLPQTARHAAGAGSPG